MPPCLLCCCRPSVRLTRWNCDRRASDPTTSWTGGTDAYGTCVTSGVNWFGKRNVAVNVIDPRDYGIDFPGHVLFTSEQELREHPERVEKIRRATIKGWRCALDDRTKTIDLVLGKYNPEQFNRAQLTREARETERLIVPDLVELGTVDLARYQRVVEAYARAGARRPDGTGTGSSSISPSSRHRLRQPSS